jgi:D-inositol-3-phosphate glycosyltransferase
VRSCRALLYCTVNGVCNNTNGLGRQAKTLLSVLENRAVELAARVGLFDVHVACPEPGPRTWAYDPADLRYAETIVDAHGGQVHPLPYETDRDFWSVPTWRELCAQAARCAAGLAERYAELIIVGVDTPFAGLGEAIRRHEPYKNCQIRTLLAFYSTALIVEHPASPPRVTWEQRGIDTANTWPDVWVADVGNYLSSHLQQEYRLDGSRLVPFHSSLDLASPDLQPMPQHAAREVIAAWGIPSDRPVVLTIR